MKNLKQLTLNALAWSFLEKVVVQSLQFTIGIFLTRILDPTDFGLMSILAIINALANAIINSGFGQALIQKETLNQTDKCSVLYFNIVISVLLYVLIFMCAPLIASYYINPILIPLSRVLSITIIINSLALTHRSLLIRDLDFKTQLKISLISVIISGALSLYLAMSGYGVWSLVILYITKDLSDTVLFWFFYKWRPSFLFSLNSLKSMFRFGSNLLVVSMVNSIFSNIYQLVIGKVYSTGMLGYYSKANSLYMLPSNLIFQVYNQVAFSSYSKIQSDLNTLREYLITSLTLITFIIFPMMLGLIFVAKPLVIVLFTEKWLPIVPYVQLLSLIGLMKPIQKINYNILNSLGFSATFLKIELYEKIFIIFLLLITFNLGIKTIIVGQIISIFLSLLVNIYFTKLSFDIKYIDFLNSIFPNLIISALTLAFVFYIDIFNFNNATFDLIFNFILYIIVYLFLHILFKTKSINFLFSFFTERFGN